MYTNGLSVTAEKRVDSSVVVVAISLGAHQSSYAAKTWRPSPLKLPQTLYTLQLYICIISSYKLCPFQIPTPVGQHGIIYYFISVYRYRRILHRIIINDTHSLWTAECSGGSRAFCETYWKLLCFSGYRGCRVVRKPQLILYALVRV